jgi:hypothetical protein
MRQHDGAASTKELFTEKARKIENLGPNLPSSTPRRKNLFSGCEIWGEPAAGEKQLL